MPLITWQDQFSVNNEELDSHHKTLIAILNGLFNECLQVDSDGCVGQKLDELLAYVEYHFKAEEQYMKQIQYYEIDDHIEKHNGFIFKLDEIKRIPHVSQLEMTNELIVFLGKWLLNHVLVDDRKYADHAASRG